MSATSHPPHTSRLLSPTEYRLAFGISTTTDATYMEFAQRYSLYVLSWSIKEMQAQQLFQLSKAPVAEA